jgi:uncharacterized protein with FMN-binding domain
MKKNIKKVFVSLLVIVGFAFYGIYQRFGDTFIKFFDNSQSGQVAAESYSDIAAGSSKNQSSANPPLNISKKIELTYTEIPALSQVDQKYKTIGADSAASSLYKDGEYDGQIIDAYYGFVQVKAIIESGRLADLEFLSYPDDKSYSIELNKKAMPVLEAAAIKNQSAQVDIFAGATNTSKAFMSSLGSALSKASTFTVADASFLQTIGSSVDIVSGATNAATGLIGTFVIQNQGTAVDIISGATNLNSGIASTDGTAIQNQGTAVDVVSGATNISSVTTATDGTAIQNQGTAVDVVSGATATTASSGTASNNENEADYSDEDDSEDKPESESDKDNEDEQDSENEDGHEGEDD